MRWLLESNVLLSSHANLTDSPNLAHRHFSSLN
jgi:hypothetical protein